MFGKLHTPEIVYTHSSWVYKGLPESYDLHVLGIHVISNVLLGVQNLSLRGCSVADISFLNSCLDGLERMFPNVFTNILYWMVSFWLLSPLEHI